YKEQKEHTHGEQEMTDNVECASTDTLRSSYSPWDRLLLLQYCDDNQLETLAGIIPSAPCLNQAQKIDLQQTLLERHYW
ncbi:hypothetical protein J6590_105467, partial [Homalodisca vitripennis]